MPLSSRSIETLIDLVEIKLSCLDVVDREDRLEHKILQQSLAELEACRSALGPATQGRTRGRGAAPSHLAA